jgi:hypothetical protein
MNQATSTTTEAINVRTIWAVKKNTHTHTHTGKKVSE